MELWYFELNWKEFQIESRNRVILLVDMLKRSRGTCRVGGHEAISFEASNPDVDRIVLNLMEGIGGTYCYQWDEDRERWINLGVLRFRPEWGKYLFIRLWKSCGIKFPGNNKVIPLKDLFSECLGENFDGIGFVGKGKFDGEKFLLRLDIDTRLSGYFDEQRCEIFNKETDEWKLWGMLVKNLD